MDETSRICPWCSTSVPAGVSACPKCGATVEGATPPEIPGVSVLDPKATLGHDEGRVPDDGVPNEQAILPPSEAVRIEMRKMKLEAEIENAGRSVMSPTGDETREVGLPSPEALAAFEAGLLDASGPAGETDFAERAKELEQEEKS
jgi:hypothetical protein